MLNCLVGDDPKQTEAEMRRNYDLLAAKYRDQFVREVISKKGSEMVSMYATHVGSMNTYL